MRLPTRSDRFLIIPMMTAINPHAADISLMVLIESSVALFGAAKALLLISESDADQPRRL